MVMSDEVDVEKLFDIPPEKFFFNPQRDITVFELAQIVKRMNIRCEKKTLDGFSPKMARHFEKVPDAQGEKK